MASRFIQAANYSLISSKVLKYFSVLIEKKTLIKIGISTGTSPQLFYKLIADFLKEFPENREKIFVYQLDEWGGLSIKDSSSCAYYMQKYVVDAWNLRQDQCQFIDGSRLFDKCYIHNLSQVYKNVSLDLSILGLGVNAHIALNEPGSAYNSQFRIISLSNTSKAHSMLSGMVKSDKPVCGITIGFKEILDSEVLYLIVAGKHKKKAYSDFINHVAEEICPAVNLYRHPQLLCFIDSSSVK